MPSSATWARCSGESEIQVMRQVNNYMTIVKVTGGQVGYPVSTQLGVQRLTQRFTLEFPTQVESGQLWVNCVP
jgi:hypothetical protein